MLAPAFGATAARAADAPHEPLRHDHGESTRYQVGGHTHVEQAGDRAGRIHRVDGPQDRKGRKSGWYRAFTDQRGAVFGDHKTGVDEVWQLRNGGKPDDLDPKEWARLQVEWAGQRKAREAEREQEWERVAAECRERYVGAKPADPSHAYLVRKKIQPASDLKQEGELLLVPMKDVETGEIMSLQTISDDGEKLNVTGGRTKGTRAVLGTRDALVAARTGGQPLYFAEGYATAASIAQATGRAAVACFSTGNLLPVATVLRKKYPAARIVFVADNDRLGPGNSGLKAAITAAHAVQGLVASPTFTVGCQNDACKKDCGGQHPSDFNDLAVLEGPEAAVRCLDAACHPDEPGERSERPRSHADLLKAATALNRNIDLDEVERIVAEAIHLNPVRRSQIYGALKKSTGPTLGTIKAT